MRNEQQVEVTSAKCGPKFKFTPQVAITILILVFPVWRQTVNHGAIVVVVVVVFVFFALFNTEVTVGRLSLHTSQVAHRAGAYPGFFLSVIGNVTALLKYECICLEITGNSTDQPLSRAGCQTKTQLVCKRGRKLLSHGRLFIKRP